ncbi:MAG: hypothetical protein ABSC20_02410 [Candidatus Bathyarchaeia archaeon]
MDDFHDSMFKGETTKGLIKVLLQKSGYSVYPYGYESTLADIRDKLFSKETKNSPTMRRIRSSPDLLVYDDEKRDLMLVEVKMRNSETPYIEQRKMNIYKEFWSDSILVLVVPLDHVFYAQRVCDLECKEKYNPNSDFLKIEEIFLRIKLDDILHYRVEALNLMHKTENKNPHK